MPEPFIFIGTHRLKEGKLDDFEKAWKELVDVVESKEPQMIAFNAYANEDGTEVAVVQLHPDAASMELHMESSGSTSPRPRGAARGDDEHPVFGELSDAARAMINTWRGPASR